mmetsp:Transcript_10747/g.34084  ORF Transcript_10747/g.34084 Transcript_10747/m.34084 type:complete len:208 (+) Transcript_10747:2199-2822(+)
MAGDEANRCGTGGAGRLGGAGGAGLFGAPPAGGPGGEPAGGPVPVADARRCELDTRPSMADSRGLDEPDMGALGEAGVAREGVVSTELLRALFFDASAAIASGFDSSIRIKSSRILSEPSESSLGEVMSRPTPGSFSDARRCLEILPRTVAHTLFAPVSSEAVPRLGVLMPDPASSTSPRGRATSMPLPSSRHRDSARASITYTSWY